MIPRTYNLDEPTTAQMNASYAADRKRAAAYRVQVELWHFRRENQRMMPPQLLGAAYAEEADYYLSALPFIQLDRADVIARIIDLYDCAQLWQTARFVETELAQ